MLVDRKVVYKVFRDGMYIGMLPNVVSEFVYRQQLNSAGTELVIDVKQSLDTAAEAVESIQDELGNSITTETGEVITTERSVELLGSKDSGALVANNNDIEAWEISSDHPNGILVFSGYVSRWQSVVGEDDITNVHVISNGIDLDDYVIGTSPFVLVTDQDSSDGFGILGNSSQPNRDTDKYGQTVTNLAYGLSRVDLQLSVGTEVGGGTYPASADVTLRFYQGTPTAFDAATLLQTVTTTISNGLPTYDWVPFVFSEEVQLLAASGYFFTIEANDYIQLKLASNNPFSDGDAFQRFNYGTTIMLTNEYDLAFRLYTGSILVNADFTSYDPSNMVTDSMGIYQSQGGEANYNPSSIDLTGISVDYTFRMATMLDVVKKARELAPADWYWYVDPATRLLYFKPTATSPSHHFIKGRHLESLSITASVESIVNVVYFTGGPVGGVNILGKFSDVPSLSVNRLNMSQQNDNRVIDEGTAQILAENYMAENSNETFLSTVTILASQYDISTIHLGDTSVFESFGSFVDVLLFQITELERHTDYVVLTLGKLPFRADSNVDQIKRDLQKQQTLDNPDQPG